MKDYILKGKSLPGSAKHAIAVNIEKIIRQIETLCQLTKWMQTLIIEKVDKEAECQPSSID